MRKLTRRQRAFALEYRVDFNAKQAALRAGYSPTCADSRGSKLLRLPTVAAFLRSFGPKDNDAPGLSREFVIKGLMEMTESDKVSERGKLEAFKQLGKFLGPSTPARALVPGVEEPSKAKAAKETPVAPVHVPDEGDDMRSMLSGAVKH